MPRHAPGHPKRDVMRLRLAQEAARIMLDQGIDDFLLAKRKAADRLRISESVALPSNAEIEAALEEQQRLFHAERHRHTLRALRHSAYQAMGLLSEFTPRLVDSVLTGTAIANTEITVHVFCDQPERVLLHLEAQGIAPTHAQKTLRYHADRQVNVPSFKFIAGEMTIEVVVLAADDIRQAPLSRVDGRPMRRADLTEVAQLLDG